MSCFRTIQRSRNNIGIYNFIFAVAAKPEPFQSLAHGNGRLDSLSESGSIFGFGEVHVGTQIPKEIVKRDVFRIVSPLFIPKIIPCVFISSKGETFIVSTEFAASAAFRTKCEATPYVPTSIV